MTTADAQVQDICQRIYDTYVTHERFAKMHILNVTVKVLSEWLWWLWSFLLLTIEGLAPVPLGWVEVCFSPLFSS